MTNTRFKHVRIENASKNGSLAAQNLTGPGRQSNGPQFWLKLCLETR